MTERWLPVREFPDHYEISDRGMVRRSKPYRSNHGITPRKPQLARNGYVVFTLSVGNKIYGRSAHRMVADAFLGPIPEGLHVNHKNGDKTDNRLENLELVTISENRAHSYRVLGIAPNKAIETNVNAKLTWDKVDAMRAEYATGTTSHSKLAAKYGLNRMTILRVLNNRAWRNEDRPATP
jgi:hypothetical protein